MIDWEEHPKWVVVIRKDWVGCRWLGEHEPLEMDAMGGIYVASLYIVAYIPDIESSWATSLSGPIHESDETRGLEG